MNAADVKSALQSAILARLAEAPNTDAAADAKVIAEVKSRLPDVPIYGTHVDGALVIFRPMTVAHRERMIEGRGEAPWWLVDECLVFPSTDEFASMCVHRVLLRANMIG